jgi:integrase/recombinase XerD
VSPTELLVEWGTEYPVANTREAYERDLRDFFAWCQQHDVDGLRPTRLDVNAYRADLLSRNLLPQTVDRKMSACRSFFTYLGDRGMLTVEHPFAHVGRLAMPGESSTPWLGADDLTKLLTVALEESPRDFLLLALLGINGLRVSEALRAAVPDLGLVDGHRALSITRKGSKPGLTPLAPFVVDVLDVFLDGRTTGPIIVRLDRNRQVATPISGISRQTAFDRVRHLADYAGVNPELSPHGLRHSFVTNALEGGAELHVVQLAVGHRDPATTMRYQRGSLSLNSNPSLSLGETLLEGVRA